MTEHVTDRLLPGNRTAFESSHLAAMAEAWPLDFDAVARQSDPDTCDEALLPFLFFDKGGTVWSDAWPVAKKRQVVRDLYTYKRLEGTPRGIEAYLNLAGAYVFREDLPPARAFAISDKGLTHAQVQALMPQLRLYHDWPDRPTTGRAFAGRNFARRSFAVRDLIGPRGRYPVLWDKGVATPLGVADAGSDGRTVTLTREGTKGSAAYAGRAFAGASCLGRPAGGERLTFDLLDPEIVLERAAPPLPKPVAMAGRGAAGQTFARNDTGARGAYDRLILNDPSRIPTQGAKASSAAFAGVTWLGLKPYHVLLKASIPGDPVLVPPRWRFAGQGFAIPERGRTLRFAMRAANAARRAGDRILIELNPTAKGGRAPALPNLDPEPAA